MTRSSRLCNLTLTPGDLETLILTMDVNEAIEWLATFIKTVEFGSETVEGLFRDSTVLISRGDQTIIFIGDDADRYTSVADSIYSAISERRPVSRKAVSDLLGDTTLAVLKEGD